MQIPALNPIKSVNSVPEGFPHVSTNYGRGTGLPCQLEKERAAILISYQSREEGSN